MNELESPWGPLSLESDWEAESAAEDPRPLASLRESGWGEELEAPEPGQAEEAEQPQLVLDGFLRGDAALRPQHTADIDGFVRQLAENPPEPGIEIVLIGHGDGSGDPESEEPLATERARAVRRALRSALRTIGLTLPLRHQGQGEDEPVADGNTPEGRRQNRRVEVYLCPAAETAPPPAPSPAPDAPPPEPIPPLGGPRFIHRPYGVPGRRRFIPRRPGWRGVRRPFRPPVRRLYGRPALRAFRPRPLRARLSPWVRRRPVGMMRPRPFGPVRPFRPMRRPIGPWARRRVFRPIQRRPWAARPRTVFRPAGVRRFRPVRPRLIGASRFGRPLGRLPLRRPVVRRGIVSGRRMALRRPFVRPRVARFSRPVIRRTLRPRR